LRLRFFPVPLFFLSLLPFFSDEISPPFDFFCFVNLFFLIFLVELSTRFFFLSLLPPFLTAGFFLPLSPFFLSADGPVDFDFPSSRPFFGVLVESTSPCSVFCVHSSPFLCVPFQSFPPRFTPFQARVSKRLLFFFFSSLPQFQ